MLVKSAGRENLTYLPHLMALLLEQLCANHPVLETRLTSVRESQTLVAMVWAAWLLGLAIATIVLEQELAVRAQRPTQWPACSKCGTRLHSKGMRPRQLMTLVGIVHWKRRVGRCPQGCQGVQVAPLDAALGVSADQQTSVELVQLGCLLAVFVPFHTVTVLLQRLTGVQLSPGTIWNWVQLVGHQAMGQLQQEIQQLTDGVYPAAEPISHQVARMPLVLGADGVMVPLRPYQGQPHGKPQWREVKVAILVRLGRRFTRKGKDICQLHQRRLVAVLGDIEALRPRLLLEALRQGLHSAEHIVWLSDGGRGFWGLYQDCFAHCAIGILDFYHAAQNLWKAAAAALDGRTTKAHQWFRLVRHQLRHGEAESVIAQLALAINFRSFPTNVHNTLRHVHDYLETHRDHIKYDHFKALGLPLGSGMVESACKWLIQQRFKGVGMRWSEDGFNHLLHLRLAWVNGRFDNLFPSRASPNR